ncbi:MAG: lipopolysaccharide biosynthesis protein [Gammaproteobacteria bacterium]|nr:lipopolysaccharide biosynthesis protein [Gammaproteobacteria bacterium]
MKSVRKNLTLSFITRYSELVVQIISTMIIARLLSPAEIGTFSVAAVIISIAHTIRDFGVGDYIVQEKELTKDRLRAAFTVTLIFSWVMAIILFSSAGIASSFYGEPGVSQVMKYLSISFLLIPFGQVTMSYLRREMNFSVLLKIRVTSTIVHAIVVVGAAVSGESYMSMVWASLSGMIVTVLLAFYYRPEELPYLPGVNQIKRVFSFGSMSSFTNLIGTFGNAAPELVIGRVSGMHYVGMFNRASSTMQLFTKFITMAIQPVVTPFFAKEHRNGESLKSPYLYGIECLTGIAWPFAIFVSIMTYPLIRVLYGSQWDEAIPVIRYLCIGFSLHIIVSMFSNLFTAIGKIKTVMKVESATQILRFAVILISAPYGILMIAKSLPVVALINLVVASYLVKRHIGIMYVDYMHIVAKGMVITLLSGAVPFSVMLIMDIRTLPELFVLTGAAFGCFIGWLLGIWITNHAIKQEIKNAYYNYKDRKKSI